MTENSRDGKDDVLRVLKPFARLGMVFIADGPNDRSPWAMTPDDANVQVGATRIPGWDVTAGELRAAARLYEALGGDYEPDAA